MRTQEYETFQAQSEDTRRGVFTATSRRLGITEFLAEKDYWVCRVIDIIMKEPPWVPKKYFKGGTSLSKGFGYIQRFSEDVDIVFNRHSLSCDERRKFQGDDDPADPNACFPSRNMREARFDKLKDACANHMQGPLQQKLERLLPECEIAVSENDPQTLFVQYPTLFGGGPGEDENNYFQPSIKVEGGARSAQSPSVNRAIAPYIQEEVSGTLDLTINAVTMIAPVRTFLEKVSIIHGINCRFRDEDRLPRDRDRVSRHAYDLARLAQCAAGRQAVCNRALLEDVRQHNQLAFRSAWRRHEQLVPGQILLRMAPEVANAMRQDYVRMQDMMFGERPDWDWVAEQIDQVHQSINRC